MAWLISRYCKNAHMPRGCCCWTSASLLVRERQPAIKASPMRPSGSQLAFPMLLPGLASLRNQRMGFHAPVSDEIEQREAVEATGVELRVDRGPYLAGGLHTLHDLWDQILDLHVVAHFLPIASTRLYSSPGAPALRDSSQIICVLGSS